MFTGKTKSSICPLCLSEVGRFSGGREGTGSRWRDALNLLALTSSLSLNETNKKIITGREKGREGEQEGLERPGPLKDMLFFSFSFHLPGTHKTPRR